MAALLRQMITPKIAESLIQAHPMRQQRYAVSRKNPLIKGLEAMAEKTRDERAPVAPDNPFLALEKMCAELVEHNWNMYRDMRDAWVELAFHGIYGTPWMRALGADTYRHADAVDVQKLPQVREAAAHARDGGYAEAIIRMLVLLARAPRLGPARPAGAIQQDASGARAVRHHAARTPQPDDSRAVDDRGIRRQGGDLHSAEAACR